jgi:pyrroloquinoline quinone biosynthesis protein E
MTAPRPYALLTEITYRCPLHCPYCSNPTQARNNDELATDEWRRVIREAAALGVLQIGFSGGEPLARRDLPDLVRAAREANLYTNLITSGIGLDDERVHRLRDAGLDSIQLSFQSDESDLSDPSPPSSALLPIKIQSPPQPLRPRHPRLITQISARRANVRLRVPDVT